MRCNNKEFLFEERSFRLFLDMLLEARDKFAVDLYNYCLMTNHTHLLFAVPTADTLSPFIHRVANLFARRFNRMRERKGHLWEERFHSTIIEGATYFLRTMAYLDLNPVRARMVASPADHQWSAHRHIAAENEAAVALHRDYVALGVDSATRYEAYLRIIEQEALRRPYSLAQTLFIGSKRFVCDMRRRFGVRRVDTDSPHIELIDLEEGVQAAELRRSRIPLAT
ncbi:MAG: transposase [Planctomycetota bacterium]